MKPYLMKPGLSAPDFELSNPEGTVVRLSSFRGVKPVVLAFLRGFF